MDAEVLTWLSNLINYAVFAFIAINLLGTNCFNVSKMLITAVTLLISLLVQLISIVIRKL